MKQSQQQTQKQQQKQGYFLSQQHLKLMHLMHLSGYALQEFLYNEVEQNPALEVENEKGEEDEVDSNGEDNVFDPELFNNDDDLFEKKYNQPLQEDYYEAPVIQYNSLQENLKEQIHQMKMPSTITLIASYIIDELDDDGYLRLPLSDVCYDYGFSNGKFVEESHFEEALLAVQSCEPSGISARDLKECLLLQLKKKIKPDEADPTLLNAKLILEQHYDLFAQQGFNKLKLQLGLSDEEWKLVLQTILHLNPKPVSETNKYELMRQQIIPDFEVTLDEEEIYVSLGQADATKLKVNSEVENLLQTNSDTEKKQVVNYYSKLVEDAEILVSALKERETTMMKIISVIATMQPKFFRTGDTKNLKPMILQDVSFATGYDISTVSRITSNKYVQTPHGIFSLKNLFMRNINPDSEHHSQHTAVSIQDEIKMLIDAEDKMNPLSDNEVALRLQQAGISLARRTVVKYREALGILNSSLRKK